MCPWGTRREMRARAGWVEVWRQPPRRLHPSARARRHAQVAAQICETHHSCPLARHDARRLWLHVPASRTHVLLDNILRDVRRPHLRSAARGRRRHLR